MRFTLIKNELLSQVFGIYSIDLENGNNLFDTFLLEYSINYQVEVKDIFSRYSSFGLATGINDNYFEETTLIQPGSISTLYENENSKLRFHSINLQHSLIILSGYIIHSPPNDLQGINDQKSKIILFDKLSAAIQNALLQSTLLDTKGGLLSSNNNLEYEYKETGN